MNIGFCQAIDILREIPDKKLTLQKEIIAQRIKVEDVRAKIKEIETATMGEVAAELDEKEKPKYSNIEKRQAECLNRQKQNPDYIALVSIACEQEQRIQENLADHEYLKDQFRSWEIISRIMCDR